MSITGLLLYAVTLYSWQK